MLNYLKGYRTGPFDSYRFYMAIKLHFSGSYDAFKYNFKTGAAKPNTFESHKHRFFFERAARNYPTHDRIVEFYVFNIISGKEWIGEMTDEAVIEKRAYLDAYEYKVQEEIKAMAEKGPFDELVLPVKLVEPPPIFHMVDEGIISLETISVINNLTDFVSYSAEKVSSGVLKDPMGLFYAKMSMIMKYQPFLKDLVNHEKVKKLILSGFTQHE